MMSKEAELIQFDEEYNISDDSNSSADENSIDREDKENENEDSESNDIEENKDDNLNNNLDLVKVLKDFIKDLILTYPELEDNLDNRLVSIVNNTYTEEMIESLRLYLSSVLPERFFDILYQNNDIFTNNELNLEFLPNINFSILWKENISDDTRTTIWKYLQLLLFSTVSGIKDNSSFGDTAKLFEAIDESEFKKKLEDTISQMQEMFQSNSSSCNEDNDESPMGNFNPEHLPDAEKLHQHVNGMMEGKLGNLAKEIAEETATDMDINLDDESSVQDVFQKLLKNPTKLMSLVKNIGNKLDKKIKSGDIKESELLEEATEIMNKMKNTPGMDNFKNMFGNMGMPKGKMNTSAMKAHLERNMKIAKQKERMQQKYNDKQNAKQETNNISNNKDEIERANKAAIELLKSEGIVDGLEMFKYSTGESYEKSRKEDKKKNKKKKKNNK